VQCSASAAASTDPMSSMIYVHGDTSKDFFLTLFSLLVASEVDVNNGFPAVIHRLLKSTRCAEEPWDILALNNTRLCVISTHPVELVSSKIKNNIV